MEKWRVAQANDGTFVANGSNPVTPLEFLTDKDAYLISAAPDMFAALVDLLRETDDGTQLCAREFVKAARAAIAKAEGKS